jgi:predicted lipoprotein with Yx(FWY)xxD motif
MKALVSSLIAPKWLRVATVIVVLLGINATAFSLWPRKDGARQSATSLPSTPAGITLQALGRGQGWDLGKETASMVYRDEVAYADANGKTIYFLAVDETARAACDAACREKFRPVTPVAGAKAVGEWKILKRQDGTSQWALGDRAAYTFVDDADPGSVFGNSAARFGAKRKDGFGNLVGGGRRGSGVRGAGVDKPNMTGWEVARIQPVGGAHQTPPGLRFTEVLDAAAVVLVDQRGLTVYTHDNAAEPPLEERGAVAHRRIPVAAPALGLPMGDFTVVTRADGRSQWAWKGRPLFTYTGDKRTGDAYGVQGPWVAAALYRHFTPTNVKYQRTASQGFVLATEAGQTLYKRDGHIYQSGGGRSLHRGAPQRPAVGRDIGINARCDDQCAQKWSPFIAPDDAEPQGYWSVYVRPDGRKQWAYQGYALWTFADDKQPGDILGHDTYDMYFAMDPRTKVDIGTPMDGVATLIWAVAFP